MLSDLKQNRSQLLALIALSAVALLFQNCAGYDSPGGGSTTASTGGPAPTTAPGAPTPTPVPPTPTPAPVCNRTNTAPPTNQNIQAQLAFNSYTIGMGQFSGTQATRNNPGVDVVSGDANSAIAAVNCDIPAGLNPAGDRGLDVNCNLTSNNVLSISFNADNGAECPPPGTVTVRVRGDDVMVNAMGAPDMVCAARNLDDQVLGTFTVNVQNGCMPTQYQEPDIDYAAGGLGTRVAVDGIWAVASAPGDAREGGVAGITGSGAISVYRLNGANWVFHQVLQGFSGGDLAYSVAISGARIAVGSYRANSREGRVSIYTRDGSNNWNFTSAITGPSTNSDFGYAVAMSGNTLVIGAPRVNAGAGIAYVYDLSDNSLDTTLGPSGGTTAAGQFGYSVATDGATVVVGAPFPGSVASRLESAYVFNVGSATAINVFRNGAGDLEGFGEAVAVDGNRVVVTAPLDDGDGTQNDTGRVYLYARPAPGPFALAANTIVPDASNQADRLGLTVAIKGNRIAVGAPDKRIGNSKTGGVYLWTVGAGNTLSNNAGNVFKVLPWAGQRGGDMGFGRSVALSDQNGWLFSGSPNASPDPVVTQSGSVFFVDVP